MNRVSTPPAMHWRSGVVATVCAAALGWHSLALAQTTSPHALEDELSTMPISANQPIIFNLPEIRDELAAESAPVNGLYQKLLFNESQAKVVLLSLEADGEKPEHRVPGTATIAVIDGSVDFTVLGKPHYLTAGQAMVILPNVSHKLKAREKSLVLVTISKADSVKGAH